MSGEEDEVNPGTFVIEKFSFDLTSVLAGHPPLWTGGLITAALIDGDGW